MQNFEYAACGLSIMFFVTYCWNVCIVWIIESAVLMNSFSTIPWSELSNSDLIFLSSSSLFIIIMISHFVMLVPKNGFIQECLQMWRVATNILNTQCRKTDNGWSSSLGIGWGLTTTTIIQQSGTKCYTMPRKDYSELKLIFNRYASLVSHSI